MFAAEREIMLQPSTQYKLCVLQGLIVEQPVQFCSLCRGVAVLVLNGDAQSSPEEAEIFIQGAAGVGHYRGRDCRSGSRSRDTGWSDRGVRYQLRQAEPAHDREGRERSTAGRKDGPVDVLTGIS